MSNIYSDTQSEDLAIALFQNLTSGTSVSVPEIDFNDPLYNVSDTTGSPLYADVTPVTMEQLTTGEIGGTGAFDTLMRAYSAHLAHEYKEKRISGTDYTQAYIGVMNQAMSQAMQFLLAKDQAYWQALLVQAQGRSAEVAVIQSRVQLATSKAGFGIALAQLNQGEAQYALTKLQLANEDARYDLLKTQDQIEEYRLASILPTELEGMNLRNAGQDIGNDLAQVQVDTATYNLTNRLPVEIIHLEKQTEVLDQQIAKSIKEVEQISYTVTDMMPAQKNLTVAQTDQVTEQTNKISAERDQVVYQTTFTLPAQRLNIEADTNIKTYQATEVLPAQAANTTADTLVKTYQKDNLLPSQKRLTDEQAEAKRAETLDVRSDGATVLGSIGKQKDLYNQQITSYQRDAEVKAAKMWMDNWISHQTIFESDDTPTSLGKASLNDVMSSIKTKNNL